ncbi:MAG: neutral/alkaline non-lysosomal ceramidase N-terminal domain-containing protein, partial [Candidatus Firestonebacteria bacterium]
MLKIKAFRTKITPETGCRLAGYAPDIFSNGVHDDLFLSGLAFSEGKKKAVLLSYDLLGMDRPLILEIRKKAAKLLKIKETEIVISCTHTHSGPHTRSNSKDSMRDLEYSKKLVGLTLEAICKAFKNLTPVDMYAYSADVFENINRRVILPGNVFAYLPHQKHLQANANGVVDPELGMVFFVERGGSKLVSSLINYSAHPLSSQTSGESSLKITSDYPGVLRRIVERELGGLCVFVTGACGDLHPKNFEGGFEKTEKMGKKLAGKIVDGYTQALRIKECKIEKTLLETRTASIPLAIKKDPKYMMPLFKNKKYEKVEVHFLRLGELCFVGVPGELLAEPGLEIKWNSPFRKTYIM